MTERACTILCLASYFKGGAFLSACRRNGAHVILITKESLADAAWPRDDVDEFYVMPDPGREPDITHAVSYLARSRRVDRIVALDEYDTLTAARLREHLRLPGLGASAARLFRDKLAMRVRARELGLPVPPFQHVLNHARLAAFMRETSAPWLLKPRAEAAAMGIKTVQTPDELWQLLDALGDEQSHFVLEQYVPGTVYHVDSIVADGRLVFASMQRYGRPPLHVVHDGGVFTSATLPPDAPEAADLAALNARLLTAFGLQNGVTHAEFIRAESDGQLIFLEVAARVGGAYIDEAIMAATGVQLWAEWARVEICAAQGRPYTLPPTHPGCAGVVVCLARQEQPDLATYADPEIVKRIGKPYHAGLVVAADSAARLQHLLDGYAERFAADFLAYVPPPDHAPP